MNITIKTTITFLAPLSDGESVQDFIIDTRNWLKSTHAPFAMDATITANIIDEEEICIMPSTASSAAL